MGLIRYLRQAWLVLVLALVFGVCLAGVNSWLAPIIQRNEGLAKEKAAIEVVPRADHAKARTFTTPAGEEVEAFQVFDAAGKTVGWALAGGANGYSGPVKVMFGLTADASTITGLTVLDNNETPGLGNKISTRSFRDRFTGKATDQPLEATKADSLQPNQVQALTGATISSDTVCRAVNQQVEAVRDLLAKAAGQGGAN